MTLALHGVIKGVGTDSPLKGLHRILWINATTDKLVLIEVPTWPKDKPAPRYYRGPQTHSLSTFSALELSGDVVVTSVHPHPMASLSDDAIRKRYPMREGKMEKKRERTECAVLQYRNERWSWVQPICDHIDTNRADAFEADELGSLVKKRAAELHREPVEIYDALHRVLAHASREKSLLPAYYRSGGKGKSRELKKATRLGRSNAAYFRGELPSPGIHLNAEDKRHITIGHSKFLKQGLSVPAAYILTLGAWWSTGSRIQDGIELPVLKPAHECPTLAQFRYWGPRDTEGKSAYELLLKDGDWEKKYRAMLGSANHGLNGVGQMGVMDATGTHVTFVSMVSMLDAIGTGHRIVVHEGLSETITGFYVGLEAPSERTASLAVYNSVIDKVELFARYGIQINSDQVPACFYRKLRVDNGEGRNAGFMQMTTAAGVALELVERRRAERKPQAESNHHVMHGLLEDRLDGATHGRSADRGEDHSAIPACWTLFDYTVELLLAIVYFNCHADASSVMARHPYRVEMERDGVPPRRAAMHAWCVKNNRISIPAHDAELIRSRALPEYKAIVKQSGVYLCRPDRGDKTELVVGPRYVGRRGMELRWHEGKRQDFPISVRMDPSNPNKIWFADELGIHALENMSDDETAKREATLDDFLAMQDLRLRRDLVGKSESNQAHSDFVSHRENKNLALRHAKQEAIARTGGKVSKKRLKSNIKSNRAEEAARIAAMIDLTMRAPKVKNSKGHTEQPVAPNHSTRGQQLVDEAAGVPGPARRSRKPPRPESVADKAEVDTAECKTSGTIAGAIVSDSLAAFRARRKQSL